VLALLHPERFIVGGGVSLMGDLWWGPLKKALAERFAFQPFAQSYDVVPSALGEEVVVIGAVLLGPVGEAQLAGLPALPRHFDQLDFVKRRGRAVAADAERVEVPHLQDGVVAHLLVGAGLAFDDQLAVEISLHPSLRTWTSDV
jgi:hypothetical protein